MRPAGLRRLPPVARSLGAGGVYFAVVFALGFALGAVRVLVTEPDLGEPVAVLLEIPVIVAASWYAARWCSALFSVPSGAADRLTMGFVAFGLTMLAEFSLSALLFRQSPAEYVATYAHFVGLSGLLAQVLFALIPYVQGTRRGGREGDVRAAVPKR